MEVVNMLDAKTNLSKMIQALENKEVDYYTIARNGKPVARLCLHEASAENCRLGVARGKYTVPDDFDWCNDEIAEEFGGIL